MTDTPETTRRHAAAPDQTHVTKSLKLASPLISCRFDPTGRYVFAGAQDNRVWRWDAKSDSDQAVEYVGHDSWVRAIAFDARRELLITGGYDGRLIWWPLEDAQPLPIREVAAHDGWIRGISVSADGSRLATVGNDLLVKIWSTADGRLEDQLAGHERHVYQVAFHPDGRHLASGDLMGRLIHWDTTTGKLERDFTIPELHKYDEVFKADIGGFRDLRFSQDGGLLACAGITNVTNAFAGVGNPLVVLWDWVEGKTKIAHQPKSKRRGVAWGVALHPQGFTIAASGGGGGGHLHFWNRDEVEEFHQFKLPDAARDLDLSIDGLRLATAHHDGQIRISKMEKKS